MLRSVHVTSYYHDSSGGVATSYNYLLKAANLRRRRVALIVPGEKDSTENVGEYGKIYRVKAARSPFFDKRYRLFTPFHYATSDSPIRRVLLAEKPDLIEIYDNTMITALAGMIRTGYFAQLNRPVLVYFTGERLDEMVKSHLFGGKFGEWFSRRLLGNYHLQMFDYYLANSEFVAQELREAFASELNPRRSERFYNFVKNRLKGSDADFSERIKICPRGVNSDFFSPSGRAETIRNGLRQKHGFPENSILLFSSVRLSREKNVFLLVKTMEILAKDSQNDFRLLIAGDGPLSEEIKKAADKTCPDRICLTGHLDKETLADCYANADAFVHPNPREPFGNVCLEAMASGVPLVAPNSGGVLTYANDENSWLCESTGESFANVLKTLVANPRIAAQKSVKARKFAQENSFENAADRLFAAYDLFQADFHSRKR